MPITIDTKVDTPPMTYCTLDTIARNRQYTDDELLDRLANDDPCAADLLMNQFGETVLRLVKRILKCEQDAEEVVMETFLTVLRKWQTFKRSSRLSSWICQIAKNHALMQLRKRRTGYSVLVSLDSELRNAGDSHTCLADLVSSEDSGPDQELAQSEIRDIIHEAIASLDPMYGDLYHMKEIQGMSLQQIADHLEMSDPAVKSRVYRARQELRCKLASVFYN